MSTHTQPAHSHIDFGRFHLVNVFMHFIRSVMSCGTQQSIRESVYLWLCAALELWGCVSVRLKICASMGVCFGARLSPGTLMFSARQSRFN